MSLKTSNATAKLWGWRALLLRVINNNTYSVFKDISDISNQGCG